MNCPGTYLILSLRKRYIRAVDIRTNNNTVRGHIDNHLIVESPILAQDKLNFVANKVEIIFISQR